MKITEIVLFCALHCLLYCLAETKDINKDICPDLTISDENPWCLNCTFIDEKSCKKFNEYIETSYNYKEYNCPNNKTCILPISWYIERAEEKNQNCPDMNKNGPNLYCLNCTTVKDDYCRYDVGFQINCQYREYSCNENNDKSCFVVHNCTAPYDSTFTAFVPKLVSFDGKEKLEEEKEGDCSDLTHLEENPGCVNCLFEKLTECKITTKYSETTHKYQEFKCPEHGGKKCILPTQYDTRYLKNPDFEFCPTSFQNDERNPYCNNCTVIETTFCHFLIVNAFHRCTYREFICPEYSDKTCKYLRWCVAGIAESPKGADHINPTALASLAGAG